MKLTQPKNILYSPYFLAFILSFIIVLFLPDLFLKYKVEVVNKGQTKHKDEIIYYSDLDGDGNSEKIKSFISGQDHYCIQVSDHEGGHIDQWNFTQKLPGYEERLIAGDYNRDGQKEIYTLSQKQDSLFLYGIIPVEEGEYTIKRRFITLLNSIDNKIRYSITDFNLVNLNNDSLKELVFGIHSGSSLQPRSICIYNIPEDSLIMSPLSGSVIGDLKFIDLKGNGYLEIIGGMGAAGNIHNSTGIPYSDYSAWLMVFDRKLNHLFEPKEFPGFHTSLSVQPYKINGNNLILALYTHTGSKDNYPVLTLYNYNGEIIAQNKFPKSPKYKSYLLKDNKKGFWIINEHGAMQKIDKNLLVAKTLDFETEITPQPIILDIDGDTKPEYIFYKRDNRNAIVFREGFVDPIEFELPGIKGRRSQSIIKSLEEQPKLYLQNGNDFAIYQYGYNYLYLLRFPVYLGIYVSILLLILLIRKLQRIQIRDKLLLQNQISELQLKTINNQLNPHFTLNAFNSIASLLKKEKGDIAYNYFIKFSNLVKSNLLSADQISVSIDDELKMVKNYLDIQKLRFKNSFKYDIKIDTNVDTNWKIPKMTIQNYIENAVKHGFKNKKSDGLLQININRKNNHISITISDNGDGRKKASETETGSTGMGMMVMNQYFTLLNKYNSVKINQEIVDLYDNDGKAAGTEVILEIPINMKCNY
ncbi:MAG: histidine kinase [Bacteroidales bacterium]|nr:histidine kinase [Bacteroidales bacterium]